MNDITAPKKQKRSSSSNDNNLAVDEPAFLPPELLADEDAPDLDSNPPRQDSIDDEQPVKKNWKRFLPHDRKQWIIVAIAGIILVVALGGGVIAITSKKKPVPPQIVKSVPQPPAPKPTTEASRLTGVQVAFELNKLPITGIMIENSPDARPQSGLKDAGVIYEAIAEGGITRFLTLFQEAQPDYVGPVRSARPYYVDWLEGYEGSLAHVGGSPDALAKIRADQVRDLDQFANSGAYRRINGRYAPHNVYTSLSSMLDLEKSKGFSSSTFTGFTRKAEKSSTIPTAKTIDIAISGPLYNVHYDYEPTTNSYNRLEGGVPHIDEKSGSQLSPKVVVAMITAQGLADDGLHTTYTTVGSGKLYVFQDGGLTEGTWEKASSKAPVIFKDAAGASLPLNPGQTWITVVGAPTNVNFKP